MNPNQYKKEKVYSKLKLDILTQRLKAGQAITEEEIGKQYEISRTPVREIFRELEYDGLVINVPYKGTYVSDLKLEDIIEILEIRNSLESFAARCAAEKIDAAGIIKFKLIEEQLENSLNNKDDVLAFDADTNLHELILEIAGNSRIQFIITNFLAQIHRIRYISSRLEGRNETTCREHLDIIQAIIKKDPDSAEEKMKTHLEHTRSILLKSASVQMN